MCISAQLTDSLSLSLNVSIYLFTEISSGCWQKALGRDFYVAMWPLTSVGVVAGFHHRRSTGVQLQPFKGHCFFQFPPYLPQEVNTPLCDRKHTSCLRRRRTVAAARLQTRPRRCTWRSARLTSATLWSVHLKRNNTSIFPVWKARSRWDGGRWGCLFGTVWFFLNLGCCHFPLHLNSPLLCSSEEFVSSWRWKVDDLHPHDHMTLLATISVGRLDISAGDCQGRIRQAKIISPQCAAGEDRVYLDI